MMKRVLWTLQVQDPQRVSPWSRIMGLLGLYWVYIEC